ncbi:MAG: hypothetical protein WCC90_20980, partial [Methylocella sp.]
DASAASASTESEDAGATPDKKPISAVSEELDTAMTDRFEALRASLKERWSRFPEQNGGLAKVDSGFDYAANFSSLACVA